MRRRRSKAHMIDFITEIQALIASGVEMELKPITLEDGTTKMIMRSKNPCAVTMVNGKITVIERKDTE